MHARVASTCSRGTVAVAGTRGCDHMHPTSLTPKSDEELSKREPVAASIVRDRPRDAASARAEPQSCEASEHDRDEEQTCTCRQRVAHPQHTTGVKSSRWARNKHADAPTTPRKRASSRWAHNGHSHTRSRPQHCSVRGADAADEAGQDAQVRSASGIHARDSTRAHDTHDTHRRHTKTHSVR